MQEPVFLPENPQSEMLSNSCYKDGNGVYTTCCGSSAPSYRCEDVYFVEGLTFIENFVCFVAYERVHMFLKVCRKMIIIIFYRRDVQGVPYFSTSARKICIFKIMSIITLPWRSIIDVLYQGQSISTICTALKYSQKENKLLPNELGISKAHSDLPDFSFLKMPWKDIAKFRKLGTREYFWWLQFTIDLFGFSFHNFFLLHALIKGAAVVRLKITSQSCWLFKLNLTKLSVCLSLAPMVIKFVYYPPLLFGGLMVVGVNHLKLYHYQLRTIETDHTITPNSRLIGESKIVQEAANFVSADVQYKYSRLYPVHIFFFV